MEQPSAPAAVAPAARPISERDRLTAIDAARGLALLGILMVNIQSFAQPFGRFMLPRPESSDLLTQVLFYVQKVLCEGKFFPLFSMLFGMGLVLQMRSVERARAAGEQRSFIRIYLRRLAVLLAFGAIHALLLWYGDILFMYAIAGVVLMLFSKLSGRAMLTIAIAIISAATLIGGPLGGFMLASEPPAAAPAAAVSESAPAPAPEVTAAPGSKTAPPADAAGTAPSTDAATSKETPRKRDELDDLADRYQFFRVINGYRDEKIEGGPEQPLWIDAESKAYRNGPWLDAFLFRATTWLFYLTFSLFGFGWIVLGMFFLGAALLKLDFFSPARRPLRRMLVLVGFLIGVPAAASAVYFAGLKGNFLAGAASMMLSFLCAPVMSLLYLSGISLIAESGKLQPIIRTLAATGRMALTNYLTHTIVCTFVFYYWGLAQFDLWTRPERVALVIGLFAAQCILSPIWLSKFQFGPMEWLWRTLTYGKMQPMRRQPAVS